MLIARRRAVLGAALAAPGLAHAQGFPTRPLRLVSPFNPGGAIDVLNRLLAERLGADLGQPVVVEARPGANTVVGAEAVARAAPDGHTFMVTTNSTHTNNPALMPNLPYDPVRDFSPITLLSMGTIVLCAPRAAPFDDMRGFLAWARARARTTYGSWGVGSAGHLYGAKIGAQENVALEHVPYRGEQPAIQDVLAGRLDMTFASPVGARPQQQAGALKLIGVPAAQRSVALPDVPTFAEQGMQGYDMGLFVAAWAPGGTPAPVVMRLHQAFVRVVGEEAIREAMLRQGQRPVVSTPDELAAAVARDAPRWAELIRLTGARAE